MTSPKPKLVSVTFEQEADCCSPAGEYQRLKIKKLDGGGGDYFVIATKAWAFDNLEELTELFALVTPQTETTEGET